MFKKLLNLFRRPKMDVLVFIDNSKYLVVNTNTEVTHFSGKMKPVKELPLKTLDLPMKMLELPFITRPEANIDPLSKEAIAEFREARRRSDNIRKGRR